MLGGSRLCGRVDQRGVTGPFAGMTRCTIGAAEASSSTNWAQATLTVSSTSGVYLKALSLTTGRRLGAAAP